jgi:hypothetical protein
LNPTYRLGPPGGWELSYRALREARELLGLRSDVEVTKSAGSRRIGCHRFREGRHFITVSTYLTPEGASRVLWHELGHAAQQEAHESHEDFRTAYRAETSLRGYDANRFEADARAGEEFHDLIPLTR